MAFFNKPEFIFPCDEYHAKTLPIHKALPGDAGEQAMIGIRRALQGESSTSVAKIEHRGVSHEIVRFFMPYTDEISVIFARNVVDDGNRILPHNLTTSKLSLRYKSQTHLSPTDPLMVFWIDETFSYCDARYQHNVLLRNPDTQFDENCRVDDEVPPKEAEEYKQAITRALHTGEEQHLKMTLKKQCCWITEDLHIHYLNDRLVMVEVRHVSSFCMKYLHLPMHKGLAFLPEDLTGGIPCR